MSQYFKVDGEQKAWSSIWLREPEVEQEADFGARSRIRGEKFEQDNIWGMVIEY